MMVSNLLTSAVINGLIFGVVLALISVGLSLIFGLMRIINFAHGGFYMIGAYVTAGLVGYLGYLPSVVVAGLVVMVLGALVEYFLLRPLYGKEHTLQILLTFALTLVISEGIIQVTTRLTGSSSMSMGVPSSLDTIFSLGFFTLSLFDFFRTVVGVAIIVAGWLMLTYTDYGTIVRGATRDREMIEAMGINVKHYWSGMFAVGTGLAGIAGGLIAPTRPITPTMDVQIILIVFVVIIFGGMGSYVGTILASLLIGLLISFTGTFWPEVSSIAVFVVLIVTLLVRPWGLMGEPEVIR